MEEHGEFQDWELLGVVESPVPLENPRDFVEIEGVSEGVIRSDYFSMDSEKRYARTVSERDLCEEDSVESDNPSWVDPGSEPRYGDDAKRELGFEGIILARKNSGFWSDSSSERSVSRKNDLGCGDVRGEVGFEGSGETKGSEPEPEPVDSGEFWSDSRGDGSSPVKVENAEGDSGSVSGDYKPELETEGLNGSNSGAILEVAAQEGEFVEGVGTISGEAMEPGEEGKRKIVWWKLPFELLKFCVFRVSPVLSLSLAATMIGVVILGWRLYKMRRRTQALPLKVTVDDKKVSQFMVRAARLNEAFSVVRRVPITLRPSLPAAGVTPWPVMSLR
ncbi:uncharacterized protein LOC122058101 [Macadamia integrifolia]|uniref:uncharacterized protein LOC122058101 n=1 Tax=Macadamia integrifolia TaxID=60698 RepID=UPI001C52CFF8|nr:uncharacterized protein LOC122058101 [Macadamia integrifolia]